MIAIRKSVRRNLYRADTSSKVRVVDTAFNLLDSYSLIFTSSSIVSENSKVIELEGVLLPGAIKLLFPSVELKILMLMEFSIYGPVKR